MFFHLLGKRWRLIVTVTLRQPKAAKEELLPFATYYRRRMLG